MEKIQPIKPSEIEGVKQSTIPEAMIKAVNSLIVKNWSANKESRILQKNIVEEYLDNLAIQEHPAEINRQVERDKVFEYHWLDIEDMYKKAGWKVKYDKPGFNESYEAFFIFEK